MSTKRRIFLASCILCVFSVLFFARSARADKEYAEDDVVTVSLLSEQKTIQPGVPFWTLIQFSIPNGWHLYAKESTEGQPPKITWTLPEGFVAKDTLFPPGEKLTFNQIPYEGYSKSLSLLTQIVPSKDVVDGKEVELRADIMWVQCNNLCVPAKDTKTLKLLVSGTAPIVDKDVERLFLDAKAAISSEVEETDSFYRSITKWSKKQSLQISHAFTYEFGAVLLFAFIGGMLLNVMPCVLPIISLKVLHFISSQHLTRGQILKNGVLFTFGVIFSFWILAFCMFSLQIVGKTVGWGFQLQEPYFVAILIVLLFAISLNLFGVFEFGTKIAGYAQELEEKSKRKSQASAAFYSGILATLVATPCTGPLLGSTIGFTITLEPVLSLIVFTVLGFGMAFPYLLVSFFPGLLRIIPRPGKWTETFKQLMGFFMLATVLWLLWVLDAETVQLSLALLFISFFFMSLGLWVYGRWSTPDRARFVRNTSIVISTLIFAFGVYVLFYEVHGAKSRTEVSQNVSEESDWIPFSEEKLADARKMGQPVFINFTAKWCLTCQANHLVLESKKVREAFDEYHVLKMVADWTNGDQEITKFLRSLGRNGVPVYALYGKDPQAAPMILPEVITQQIVIDALKKVSE